eukprot:scaffold11018_cov64-Phaeocystis_antarctica.AAC.1
MRQQGATQVFFTRRHRAVTARTRRVVTARRAMVTSLLAETASNDDARDDDDDDDDDNACSLSVLELSLFCEEQTTEAAADDAMPDYVEDHESLARPKASWAVPVMLLARPKAPSSKSNTKEKKGKLPIRTSFNSVIDLNGLEASAEPTVACKAESSTRSRRSPCQACRLLADGGRGPNFCYDCAEEYINFAYPQGIMARVRREHVGPILWFPEHGSSAPESRLRPPTPSEVAISVALSVATNRHAHVPKIGRRRGCF